MEIRSVNNRSSRDHVYLEMGSVEKNTSIEEEECGKEYEK